MVTQTRRGKILIVDDEEVVRRTIRKALTRRGYDCTEANDSLTVLKQIENERPDLVILDIMMPGKSGRELLPEIVACHPQVAVIMATAVVDPNTIIECMKSGAQDYMTKPFDLEEITMNVDKVIEMNRLKQEINEYNKHLEHTVDDQKKEIREIFLSSIEVLVCALEAKDKYTAGHSRRVTDYAVAIGREMGLPSDELENLRWGSLLHDVGKIAIDPAIQNKPGRLTDEEYRCMMTHSMIGAGIVRPLSNQKMVEIIIHHHDHYCGSGLDQKVRGTEIPLGARIVTVADSFDAMTSDRPYRPALSLDEGMAEIKRCSGTQFDPEVVAAFLRLPSPLR